MTELYHAIQLPLFSIQEPSATPKTVTLICAICHKEFQRQKIQHDKVVHRYGERPVYCSKPCLSQHRTLPLPSSIGEEYLQGSSLLDIAQKYKTVESVIYNRLTKMGIVMRKGNASWKNGHPLQSKGGHTKESIDKIRAAAIQQFSRPGAREEDAHRTTSYMMSGKIKKSSSLEDRVAIELSNQGIAFTRQYGINIPGTQGYIGCLDFMLADGRGIEVNGTYWHADPRKYPDGPISKTQKHNVERYNRKMARLAELGIPLIELWEMDLTKDLPGTIARALATHNDTSSSVKAS